jgi:hypothetical protein
LALASNEKTGKCHRHLRDATFEADDALVRSTLDSAAVQNPIASGSQNIDAGEDADLAHGPKSARHHHQVMAAIGGTLVQRMERKSDVVLQQQLAEIAVANRPNPALMLERILSIDHH